MKNLFYNISIASLIASGLFAEGDNGCCNPCPEPCEPCCVPKPKKCINCECYTPAYYDLQCDWGMFLDAEFLYWYATECGSIYAEVHKTYSSTSLFNISVPPAYLYSEKFMDVNWDPGVRVGLGFNTCDGWDIGAYWTWYKNTASSSTSVPEGFSGSSPAGTLYLTSPWLVTPTGFSGALDKVKAKWEFTINELDVVIGRRYWLSKCFTLRPFIGVKAVWMKITNSFDFYRTNHPVTNGISNTSISDTHHFRDTAAGIVGGLQPNWYFTNCFSLYGDFNVALLWGKYKKRLKGSAFEEETISGVTKIVYDYKASGRSHYYGLQSMIDLGIGLRWEDTWCCDRYRTALDIGWEHQYWGGTEGSLEVGRVGFGGLVIRGKIDF